MRKKQIKEEKIEKSEESLPELQELKESLPKTQESLPKIQESIDNLVTENFEDIEIDNTVIALSGELKNNLLPIGKVRRIENTLKSFWNRTKVFRRKYELWVLLKTGAFYDTLFKRSISPLHEFCVFSGFKIHYDIRIPTLIQKNMYIYCYDLKDGRILSFNENIAQVINPKEGICHHLANERDDVKWKK